MQRKYRFYVQREPFRGDGISVYGGFNEPVCGVHTVFSPVSVQEVSGGEITSPFMTMDESSAQSLFDELYLAGFRPARNEDILSKSEGAHVQDLRMIAFKLLDIQSDK